MIVPMWSLLAACGGDGVDYVLELAPVVVDDQEPFADLERIDFVLDHAEGDAVRASVESPPAGSVSVTDLPELVDTSIVIEGYRDGLMVSYGRSEPLTATTGTVTATLLMGETDRAASLTAFQGGAFLPMVAALGGGRFLLAGGMLNDSQGNFKTTASDAVWILTLAPPDDPPAFAEQESTLPTYPDAFEDTSAGLTGRMAASFTPLTVDGADQGKILLAGGSEEVPDDDGTLITAGISLYDPASDSWEPTLERGLTVPRARHLAIENARGDVVISGGWTLYDQDGVIGETVTSTVEVYDRDTQRFDEAGYTSVGQLDAAAADLGDDGTLLCGGGNMLFPTEYEASDACYVVGLDRSLSQVLNLPEPRAGLAMITLADGRVLVTGGADTGGAIGFSDDESPSAAAEAWIAGPDIDDGWTQLENMNVARAGHRMALLPDGRVLVAGGGADYHPFYGTQTGLPCLEIFDPDASADADPNTHDFTALSGCAAGDAAGDLYAAAYQPELAVDPDFGVLIVGGLVSYETSSDGVDLFIPSR